MSGITRRALQIGLLASGAGALLARGAALAETGEAAPAAAPAAGAPLVFIAASGDGGFRLEGGASAAFVAALVVIASGDAARTVEAALRDAKAALGIADQLRFKSAKAEAKEAVFTALAGAPFAVHAAVLRKAQIVSPRLRGDETRFQRFFVSRLMKQAASLSGGARVVDRSCNRAFRSELARRLAKKGGGRPRSVTFAAPQSDLLLQLAGLCAGAFARATREGDAEAARWRTMLAGRTAAVWDIV